ncbi:hypothetical protein Tiera_052 [Polaromonas phage Tiera]|nr:hypothetical protein Tiera_052 [Polaromonas phage Tiera]
MNAIACSLDTGNQLQTVPTSIEAYQPTPCRKATASIPETGAALGLFTG